MTNPAAQALFFFTQRYTDAYQAQHNTWPKHEEFVGLPSPCIINTHDDGVEWKAIKREVQADFSNIETGIELILHDDIKTFYSVQLCADLSAAWRGNQLSLVQVWSDDDFIRLQENILGHLFMQKQLKLKPTVFIGSTDSELDVISICNLSGQVIFERIGTDKRDVLAENLTEFLTHLEPVV